MVQIHGEIEGRSDDTRKRAEVIKSILGEPNGLGDEAVVHDNWLLQKVFERNFVSEIENALPKVWGKKNKGSQSHMGTNRCVDVLINQRHKWSLYIEKRELNYWKRLVYDMIFMINTNASRVYHPVLIFSW